MPMLVSPAGEKVESLEKQLERLDKEILAVEKKKLVTIIEPGAPDKVLYVEPFDLRGKDPEEDVEKIESYVIETKWDNGFAQHVTGKRPTGLFEKRGPKGPFGYTYKIDKSNQNGQQEWAEFQRILEMHCNRLTKVPEALPYHRDIDELGHADLKNITLQKEDVPVAVLENYAPLENLKKQRDIVVEKIKATKLGDMGKMTDKKVKE